MAAPARTTQSLVLAAADGADASARVTQSLVLAAIAGGVPNVTQALALVACEGPEAAAPFVTQSLALLACEGPEAAAANVTQSLVLVAAPSPAPSRVTQVNILLAADRDTTGPNATQCLILICSEDAAVAVEGPRITQATALLACDRDTTGPFVTQSLCLVASGPTCPAALTSYILGLREMTDRTLRMLGEQTTAPMYWTRAEIGRYLNDANREFVRRTKVLESIVSSTTVVGQDEYTLASTVMGIIRVFVDDRSIPNTTRLELDYERGNWEGQSSRHVRSYVTSQMAPRTIKFDTSPSVAEDLDVWVFSLPDELEDACDAPDAPAWSHLALCYMAASRALAKGGETRDPLRSKAYAAIADEYVTLMQGHVAIRSGER
jgi:hypothetical protein